MEILVIAKKKWIPGSTEIGVFGANDLDFKRILKRADERVELVLSRRKFG